MKCTHYDEQWSNKSVKEEAMKIRNKMKIILSFSKADSYSSSIHSLNDATIKKINSVFISKLGKGTLMPINVQAFDIKKNI